MLDSFCPILMGSRETEVQRTEVTCHERHCEFSFFSLARHAELGHLTPVGAPYEARERNGHVKLILACPWFLSSRWFCSLLCMSYIEPGLVET